MEQLPNKNKEELKLATVTELKAMLDAIDSEIVGVGENMSDQRLRELTLRKGQLTRWIAQMKGEPITDGTVDNLFR